MLALTALPGQADTSTPSAASEQVKPVTDAEELTEDHAASAPSAEPVPAENKKPTEQAAIQAGAGTEPKPGQAALSSDEGDMFLAES
ncbi:MAG: hypothetical protein NVV62_15565 [Terricaulis sp.]|nr:hypothetical protein [Terricaulis sp.]